MPPQLIQTCVCQVSPSFLDFPGRRAPGRYGVMHPPCQRLGGGGQRIRSSRPASPATASLRPVWAMGEILPESRTKQNVQVSDAAMIAASMEPCSLLGGPASAPHPELGSENSNMSASHPRISVCFTDTPRFGEITQQRLGRRPSWYSTCQESIRS